MSRTLMRLLSLTLMGLALAQALDPVTDLFVPRPPIPAGIEQGPPLRPPEESSASAPTAPAPAMALPRPIQPLPRRSPLMLKDGDSVVFLGDAVLEAEAVHGYLETRLDSHFPTNRLVFRNLTSSPHNRLREADPAALLSDTEWQTRLVDELRELKPSTVFLSYGTAPALRGEEALGPFTNAYARFIEAVRTSDTSAPPRLVVVSPLSYEPPGEVTLAEVTNRNATVIKFAEATWHLATNANAWFVDAFGTTRQEILSALRARERGQAVPRLTTNGWHLTPYGAWRLSAALDRMLGTPNNWRFGLMSNNTWRSGGYGALIHTHQRSDRHARIEFTEERLPTPNPSVEFELTKLNKAHSYIQIRGLVSGMYELRVDGKAVLSGTHSEWERYEIIAWGPSWDQAEELRRMIVRKNELWHAWRQQQRAGGFRVPATNAPPAVLELEAAIARQKRPVRRVYEVVRVGDAPPPPTAGSETNSPPAGAR